MQTLVPNVVFLYNHPVNYSMRAVFIALNLLLVLTLFAQTDSSWQLTELAPIPEKVTNNAVVEAQVNDQWYVYSFAGLDSTLLYSGIHLKGFKYNVSQNSWSALPGLPDTLGKIAAAASNVKGKIYIIGGYHVFANGDEISSDKVHVFDPETDNYLPDGAPVPVPVDDQVQGVWRDSLIYVVGGWSNTAHTTAVQIYNPATNTWMQGTPIPDNSDFKAFGAAGVIVGDTIYYMGGARPGLTFPIAPELRMGVIDPDQPDFIVWTRQVVFGSAGYRMGAASLGSRPIWLGGATLSYNYNGFSYDGSGIAPAVPRVMIYDVPGDSIIFQDSAFVALMDMRGVAEIGEGRYVVCGGMVNGALATDKTWLLQYNWPTGIVDIENAWDIQLYPNPASDKLYIRSEVPITRVVIYDLQGKAVIQLDELTTMAEFSLQHLEQGVYLLYAENVDGLILRRKVVIR